jgi:hypothetical protein
MPERNRDDDVVLMRDAAMLGQHIESLTAEVRELYHKWVLADWHRMKGLEGAASPYRMEALTAKANEAKATYEARFSYREERIESNANYLREKVRNER